MDISIIIVSYNVRDYLRQCLDSVWKSAVKGNLNVEVFVVDNNSSDNSVDYLISAFPEDQFPQLHFISNQQNVGFGHANNQAVKESQGKYILFLNPDTIITENTLRDCFDFAERQKDLGAMGVKMLGAKGEFSLESRRGLPTPWVAFCKMSGLSALFPKSRLFGKYYMQYLDKEKPAEIEIISGAFMFCHSDALKMCGGFDETFFMYGEDIDLSYRFLLASRHNWYIPTPILHYKGESTKKGSFKYVHAFYDAMLIFFKKHFHKASLMLSILVKAAILFRACIALVQQKVQVLLGRLNSSKDNAPINVHFIGSLESQNILLENSNSWGFKVTCGTSMDEEIPSQTQIVAYDAEAFSYGNILNDLTAKHCAIGTFFPSRHTMIFSGGIYK